MCMGIWDEHLWLACMEKDEYKKHVSRLAEGGKIQMRIRHATFVGSTYITEK